MPQSFYGSINFDSLLNGLKSGELKTFVNAEGKRFININIYVNDEDDKYGNRGSVSVPLKEEFQTDNHKRYYIGNIKLSTPQIKEGTAQDFQLVDDDLPF